MGWRRRPYDGGAVGGSGAGARLKEARTACRAALKQTKVRQDRARPGAGALQGTYEWLRGRPRRAEKWWRKSLDHAEQLGCRYEGALTALEMGRRLGDREQLEHAEAEFADMGAQFRLAQTRELLEATEEDSLGAVAAGLR